MPYVALAPVLQQTSLETAAVRWADILSLKPDLEPAVALQRHLLGVVARLTAVLESAPLPRLSLPANYLAAKLSTGVPALSGEPIPLPVDLLTPALLELCRAPVTRRSRRTGRSHQGRNR